MSSLAGSIWGRSRWEYLDATSLLETILMLWRFELVLCVRPWTGKPNPISNINRTMALAPSRGRGAVFRAGLEAMSYFAQKPAFSQGIMLLGVTTSLLDRWRFIRAVTAGLELRRSLVRPGSAL